MVAGYSYQWSDSNGAIFGATNPIYMASETSNYTIQVIDTNYATFCTSTAMLPVKVVKKVLPVVSNIAGD
jgi:DNA-binding beta-propeller fold protein YncE